MTQLRSFSHQIVVNSVDKIALSSFDDKRYIKDDGMKFIHFPRKFIISWTIAEEKLAYLICFPGVAVYLGIECRARGLYKKTFQEAGYRKTTPTLIPQSVYKFSYHFTLVKTSNHKIGAAYVICGRFTVL